MKILYDNTLKYYDSIIATNQSDNRPIENILHNFLELPFQATKNNSEITIILDQDYSMNCFAYGFHNMDAMTIDLKDVFDALLTSFIFIPPSYPGPEPDENIYYFNQVNNVRKIIITAFTPASYLIIGNFSFGIYLELPEFLQAPDNNTDIRDLIFESGSGQSGGNRQRNLDNISLSFPDVTHEKRNEIKKYLSFVQRSIPHYIDQYPDAWEKTKPFYGKVISSNIPQPKRRIRDFRYNIDISWRQAR